MPESRHLNPQQKRPAELQPFRRSAYPGSKPGQVTSVAPASRTQVIRDSAKEASKGVRRNTKSGGTQGMAVAPGTELGRIKQVALRTFGFKSVLWLRQQIELDRSILEMDRSSFIKTWWEMATFFSPRSPRFLESDVNHGWIRNYQIVDDTAGICKDVLKAGMLAGMSSPTRQWFNIMTSDYNLMEQQSVKDWCYDTSAAIAAVFNKGNLYEELPQWYEDSAVFGTALIWMEESLKDTVRFRRLPVGSYSMHHDNEGNICKFYRAFMMTVTQLLDEFGQRDANGEITNWEHFSQAVRNAHDNHNEDYWFYVGHYIRPNKEYEPEAPGTRGAPFLEVYFERGQVNSSAPGVDTTNTGSEQWRFLRVRGIQQMPLMELIWQKTGEDDYGTEYPGMRSLGDVKQLQAQERKTSKGSELMINPALHGPMSLKTARVSLMPGDVTTYDQRGRDEGLRPIHEVNLNISMMENRSDRIRNRIREAWYYDLFLMMQAVDQQKEQPITATEVREKKEEKLLMLSPVLEKANRRGFAPLIQFAFRAMQRRGTIPELPAALKGKPLTVEFTSIFSQALKMLELESIKDFEADLMPLTQTFGPAILDNIDADELLRMRADKGNLPAHILKDEKVVAQVRAQRAKQQAQQAQMQQMQQAADVAKTAAAAPTDPNQPNALTEMMQQAKNQQIQPQV